jgi:hypothetical protein
MTIPNAGKEDNQRMFIQKQSDQGWAIQMNGTIDGTVILLPTKIPWNRTVTIYRPYLHTLVHT